MTAAERSAALRDVPASVGQRLLWFLDRYRAGGAALNCPLVCRLDGPLDVPRLRASIGLLVSRHEALRTTIERRGRLLRQVVHATPDPRLDVVDVSAEYDAEQSALRGVERELRTRIDPGGFPVRATLWKIAAYSHLFCLNVHHLASDAWSGWIQMRDVTSFYAAGAAPSDAAHQPALQYADFTARQDDYLRSAGFAQDLRYWREHLAGARFDTVPLAAADAARPRRTARARVAVPAAEAALLRATARNCGTTLFGLMLALYFATVHRLTGESDLAIGSLFANRLRPELHNTVGFLANVVVLRTVLSPGATYGTVVRAVHEELREAFVHQQCPLHLLPGDVTARGGRRADETVFQMLPQPLDGGRMGDVGIAMVAPDVESRFDFEATVMVEQGDLALMVLWNEARLSSDWVDRFLREYRASVSAVVRDPGAGVARG